MFLSRGDRDLGVAFQTPPGRQTTPYFFICFFQTELREDVWLPVAQFSVFILKAAKYLHFILNI